MNAMTAGTPSSHMKRLRDLTVDDLRAIAVWRSLGGPDDTAEVEPTALTALSEAERETMLAITDFELANGARFLGFCSPVDDSGLDYIQPVILTHRGHVRFWFDEPPTRAVIAEQWSKLGVPDAEIFPVRYECRVAVDGRIVKGMIPNLRSVGGAA